MSMSPRLLRPRASGDPDALAYIAAVQTADGQSLEAGVAKAITDFVVGCKADGIWTAIKSSCILMGARTLTGALTPLKGTAPTSNAFVGDATDYNRKTGLLGNGSTKYLNTNRAGNADGQNDKHVSFYVSTADKSGLKMLGGYFDGNDVNGRVDIFHLSGNWYAYIHSGTTFSGVAVPDSPGFFGIARASSSQHTTRASGTTTTTNSTSSAPSALNYYTHARNDSGTASYVSSNRIAFYSIGSALTLATLDTRVSALYTAIGAAIA